MKTPTQMVRQFAAAHTIVRRKQVREQLGLSPEAATQAFDNLIKAGWLKRIGHGIYEFTNRPPGQQRPSPINDKLWRAMRINPRFSGAEIARQAGTTRNYANKVLRKYLRAGYVRRMGQRTNTTGSHETAWMLTAKGKKSIARPQVKKFEIDPLVKKAVELNRLICTGVATHNPEDGATAIRLCRELIESIDQAENTTDT